MKKISILFTVIGLVLFFSCKKTYNVAATSTSPAGYAFLKIVHAAPHFTLVTKAKDSLWIYEDSTKVCGAPMAFNTAFPTIGSVNTYAAVAPGDHNIMIESVPTVAGGQRDTIYSIHETLNAGSYYTFLITDSLQSAQYAGTTWRQDNLPTLSSGNSAIRFVHVVMDTKNTDPKSLYDKHRATTLFSGINTDSITDFTSVPLLTGLDTFYVRDNTNTTVATNIITTPMVDQGAYTLYYMGDTAKAVAAKKQALILVQNK